MRPEGKHQLGKDLSHAQVEQIVAWLKTLTGELPKEYIAKPDLPRAGPTRRSPLRIERGPLV